MATTAYAEAKELAAAHGWAIQEGGGYPDGSDRAGAMFTRNDEIMTSEWFNGTDAQGEFVWADYVGPSCAPDGVYVTDLDVMRGYLAAAPTATADHAHSKPH